MGNFNLNDVIEHSINKERDGISLSKMQELEGRFGNNGSYKCDVIDGPCSCGGWHSPDEIYNERISIDKSLVSVSQFKKLMNQYKFIEIGKDKEGFEGYFLLEGEEIKNIVGYKPGKFYFSGPRKSIFNIEERIAKDLSLKKV